MVGKADGRPSAEEMLDRVRRQAGAGARGRHRVYLGIAPGVGKTYTALEASGLFEELKLNPARIPPNELNWNGTQAR